MIHKSNAFSFPLSASGRLIKQIGAERYNQLREFYDDKEINQLIRDYGNKVIKQGYDIYDYDQTGMLQIEKVDILHAFESDIEAAEQALKDGVKLIPIEELPDNFKYKELVWIDTEENREAIRKYCEEE